MKYLFRAIVDLVTQPMLVTLLLLIVALFLYWRGHRRASFRTSVTAVVLLYLCGWSPVTTALLDPLESPYRAIDAAHLPQGIAGIAVLGAAYSPGDGLPITAALSAEGLQRAAEGVRLAKHYGNVRLVLSGGVPPGYGLTPSARGYERFAHEMGIDPASIVVLDQSLNTADEVPNLSKFFGKSPFLLVTSANHMRRAMMLFEHNTDAHPIPAPTSQHNGRSSPNIFGDILPSNDNLSGTHLALHEYLGILAIRLGQG